MENPGSPGSSRAPVDETVLSTPPATHSPEINFTYKLSTPDNCISCFSKTCNDHGQLHSCFNFSDSYEIPISMEDPDGKTGFNISDEFPAPLQSSFYDESKNEVDNSSYKIEKPELENVGVHIAAPENEFAAVPNDEPEIVIAAVSDDKPGTENDGVSHPRVLRDRPITAFFAVVSKTTTLN